MVAYTQQELREQGWDDEKIRVWGEESGKVFGIGARAHQADRGTSSEATAGELRRDTDSGTGGLRATSTMELLGNAGAGRDRIDVGAFDAGSGRTLLYDDVTGAVYATSNWDDVSRNEQAWVDSRGLRFRGWAVAYGSEGVGDESEALYNLQSVDEIDYTARKKGGQNMLAAFGDASVPQAGTAEFQDWVRKEVTVAGMAQAYGNTYNPTTGKFGKGTDMGQYGFISAKDWLESGRRTSGIAGAHSLSLGEDQLAALESMSDDEVLATYGGGFFTSDTKRRKSGIEKSLGSTGAKIANIVVPAVAGMLPGGVVLGSLAQTGMAGAQAYAATGGDWDTVAKEMGISVGVQAASAALAAATAGLGSGAAAAANAANAAKAGGLSLASSYAATAGWGAVRGAISAAGATLADSALRRVTYGSDFDGRLSTSGILKGVARGGAIGAITGAINSSAGKFFQTSPEAIGQNRWAAANLPGAPAALSADSWQTGVSGMLFDAGLRGGSAYGVQRLFGVDPEQAGLAASMSILASFAESSSDVRSNELSGGTGRGDSAAAAGAGFQFGGFWNRFANQFGPAYAVRAGTRGVSAGIGRVQSYRGQRRYQLAAATNQAYADHWY